MEISNTDKLENFKKIVEQAKTARTRAETQIEALEKQEKELVEEMQKYGVTTDTINEKICDLEKEINTLMADCEKIAAELKEVLGG